MAVDATQKQAAQRKRAVARERFKRAHLAEKKFSRQLRSVANEVGKIVRKLAPRGVVENMPRLQEALGRYSNMLKPWAESAAKSLVTEVAQRDLQSWTELGEEIGQGLSKEVRKAPTGRAMQSILEEQVDLITSLPRKAAERVHRLTVEAIAGGRRAASIAQEIMKTGQVTASRAKLIAQTETTRTATAMVEARARFIGSTQYIWRTADDADVRTRHKQLEGQVFKWDKPPVAGEKGERYHPGAGPNCRCWPEPIIPDITV